MSALLVREIDQIFNSMLNGDARYSKNYYHNSSNKDEYILQIPMIGITRDKLSVDIQDNVLTIVATKSENSSVFAENFKNSWTLANDADVSFVTANLENGVLTVKVPKIKTPKRTVTVNVN